MKRLNAEDVLDLRKGYFVKDLCRLNSLIFEEILCTEVLSHTVPSLLAHVLTLFVNELVSPTFLTRLCLIRSFRKDFFDDIL